MWRCGRSVTGAVRVGCSGSDLNAGKRGAERLQLAHKHIEQMSRSEKDALLAQEDVRGGAGCPKCRYLGCSRCREDMDVD